MPANGTSLYVASRSPAAPLDTVVVTGASGFIGAHLCRALERAGARVVRLGHPAVDLTDESAVRAAVSSCGQCRVVHLAAMRPRESTLGEFRLALDTNVYGLLNVLQALEGRCSRLVVLGSMEEFGAVPAPFDAETREAPTTPYGVSKLAATHLVGALARRGDVSAVILRPTVVYGPGQEGTMLVPALTRALTSGQRFPMSLGEQTRDFVYVDDVVAAITGALVAPAPPIIPLPVSSGVPVRVRDVALSIARAVGGGAEALIDFGAVPYRPAEPMVYWAENNATRAALGWAPTVSLEDGLRRTVEAWRAQRAQDT